VGGLPAALLPPGASPQEAPEQVLAYLACYTHRVTTSNSRLVRLEGEEVTFTWKDYADHDRMREMTLSGEEFLRRFLLHVLPEGSEDMQQPIRMPPGMRCQRSSDLDGRPAQKVS
jgi:hypothetical protein